MALAFPSNPTTNQTYTYLGTTYTFNGTKWRKSTTSGATVTVSTTVPSSTTQGSLWLDTDLGDVSVYSGTGWLNIGGGATAGSTGYNGSVGYTGSGGATALPKITSIAVTDSSYTVLDDTAVSTGGGYIKIIGTGFTTGSQVLVGTVAASSVSWISSTELRAQVSATAAGTYVVYVVATDGAVAIRVNGITFSSTPTWSTGGSLGSSGVTISIQLAAVSDTTITYSVAAGSTLPTGLSLSSSGLLSGTVTGVTVDTTYNFTITATDLEYQDSPRTFSITITVKDAYFPYVPLLLETAASSTRSTVVTDASTNAFTVTRSGTPSTGWVSPYQTDGYWGNYFGTTTSDNIYAASNVAFTVGTNNFTVEFWANWTAWSGEQRMILMGQSGSSAIEIGRVAGANALNIYTNNSSKISYTWTPTLGTWYHVAVVRSGTGTNQLTLYINGTNVGTGTSADSITTNNFIIGGLTWAAGYNMQGYISNVRFVNGTAVYTGSFTPSTTPLTAIANTALLTCQSNRFRDNSTNNFAITVSSTPQVTGYYYPNTFTTPAASPGAALFNGSTDYLTSTIPALSGVFTIDFWLYRPSSGNNYFFTIGDAITSTSLEVYIGSSGTVFNVWSNNAARITSSTLPTVGAWNYIAVTRDASNVITFYLNGSQIGSTYTSAVTFATTLRIGVEYYNGSISGYGNNYISNFRISNNIRTVNSIPTASFISDANTFLLLNLADSNYTSATNGVQNNTFIDTGPYAFTITRNGTATQGSITPYWPNGQWSNYFGGTSDWLNSTASTVLQFGSSAYTVEGWIYQTSRAGTTSSTYQFICGGVFSGTGYQVILFDSGYIAFGIPGFASLTAATIAIPLNAWTHFALVRTSTSAGGFAYYINGAAAGTITDANNYSGTTTTLNVAATNNTLGGNPPLTGYLSNFRIVKGTAVYTGAFTPPTSPLAATQSGNGSTIQAITGTQTSLLTCQSNRFVDNSAQVTPATLTPTGTPRVQAFQPFSPTAAYTTALYGGSGYFNGSTDILTVASNAAFGFGTGDFTVEFWIYPLVTANSWSIYHGTATNAFIINTTTSGQVTARSYGVADLLTTTATLAVNAWTHLAVTRNGTTLTIWLNGVSSGTVTNSTSFATTGLYIGRADSVTAYLNGYMSNLRVVKGTAAYTAVFTPPTAPVTAIANTSLLLNFTNAAIYDATTQNNAITVGDAQASSAITAKWPPTSIRFDPTTGAATDSLTMPLTPATTITSGNFTIEFWLNPSTVASATQAIIGTAENDGSSGINWMVYLVSSSLYFQCYSNASALMVQFSHQTTLSAGTWYYCALTRNGSTFTLYLNGVASTSTPTSAATISQSGTTLYVGKFGASSTIGALNGYLQDVRMTRGVARTITASPTAAFQPQ